MTFWHGFKLMFNKDPNARKWAKPLMERGINVVRYGSKNAIDFNNNRDEWERFHIAHGGKIKNQGGGGNNDLYCDKCGGEW